MDLIDLAERAILPDWLIRLGMRRLMANRLRDVDRGDAEEQRERLRQFLEPTAIAAPSPSRPTPPTGSTTRCPRPSSSGCWGRG